MNKVSRRSVIKSATGLLALAAPMVLRAQPASRQLVVSGWGGTFQDAMRKALFEPFSKETGIRVMEVTYGGQGLARVKAQLDAGKVEVDLMDGPPFWPIMGAGQGLLEKMDLSNVSDKASHLQGAIGDYGYGYAATSWGIAYSTKTYTASAPKNWKDFWNVEAFKGRRALFGSIAVRHLEYALMADGVPTAQVNPLDPAKVDRAFRKLDQIKDKMAVWYQTNAQMESLLVNGEIDMGELTSNRAHYLGTQGAPIQFQYNEAVMNQLVLVMAKNAPNKANAEAFLRFCSRPDRQAELSTITFTGPSNSKALAMIKDDMLLKALPTSPHNLQQQVQLDSQFWAANLAPLGPRWAQLTSK
jgi:putative spermidine/putrescine transport system substrate-binding protein